MARSDDVKKEISILEKRTLTMKESDIDKKLLTINEVCRYLGIGQTKARELVKGHNGFGVQIGNRWYADKKKLDKWLDKMSL